MDVKFYTLFIKSYHTICSLEELVLTGNETRRSKVNVRRGSEIVNMWYGLHMHKVCLVVIGTSKGQGLLLYKYPNLKKRLIEVVKVK